MNGVYVCLASNKVLEQLISDAPSLYNIAYMHADLLVCVISSWIEAQLLDHSVSQVTANTLV